MTLPGRHSLLWRLTGALALFCLFLASLYADLGRFVTEASSYLSDSSRQVLLDYAEEAEHAWRRDGAEGVDAFLVRLRERESVWAVVVDNGKRSLSSRPLDDEESQRLDFVRRLDFPVGRPDGTPSFYIPFSDGQGRLVMDLPWHLSPRRYSDLWNLLLERLLPALLAVLFGVVLYRVLIAPLSIMRRQAAALSAGDLSARLGPDMVKRRDELGELARTFDHMAERLEGTVAYQRQLLRALSHELRTPLARLRVAGESEQDLAALRQRLEREVQTMEKLVGDALELVWLDTERPSLPLEEVDVVRLWDVLRENAGFETGWPAERMPCDLPANCRVMGNLNGLAQALENILRNAIRHSPQGGVVRLQGWLENGRWHLQLSDEGCGVDESELEFIFKPFARLDDARPGDGGFGLGLSIARGAIALQGGQMWATSPQRRGLHMHVLLPAALDAT